ncbi:hypothetical protein BDW69DRAFT_146408 [Aspergillus filifer]
MTLTKNQGKYTHAHGLRFESVASTFPSPGKDGFLVHDSCYRMLRLVASLDNKPLPLRDLYLTMKACPKDAIADVIDWKDPRSYGGAEMWAHADGWRAQASHEVCICSLLYANPALESLTTIKWLVMDPFVELSAPLFLDYASQSSVVKEGSPTWGPATARPRRTAGDNPILTTLPLEIRQMIIEYLPSSSVLNLAIASPAFHAAIRHLPNSFWKSRLQHDYRWLRCQGSRGYFGDLDLHRKSRLRLNFYALLMALDYHSRPLPNGKLVKDDKPTFFGFKNYRRIWNCAEAILSRVEARIAKSLVNHAMRVQQVDFVKYLRVVNTVYISLEKQIFSVTGFYQQGAHKKHGDGEQRQFGGLLFEFADHSTQYAGDARLYESERVSGQDIVKHSIFFDVLGKEVITDTATFWFGTSDGSGYQVVHFSTSNVHEVTLGAAHRQWHDKMSSCPSKKGGLSAIIDEAGKVRTIERPGIQIATQSMVENRKARRRQSQKEKRIVGLDVKFRKGPEGNLILCGIERVAGW